MCRRCGLRVVTIAGLCVFLCLCSALSVFRFFFFNDTATTEIYTLSLHDALPISGRGSAFHFTIVGERGENVLPAVPEVPPQDRKSTRLNSSHGYISYAVFCLKKKKKAISVNRHWHVTPVSFSLVLLILHFSLLFL